MDKETMSIKELDLDVVTVINPALPDREQSVTFSVFSFDGDTPKELVASNIPSEELAKLFAASPSMQSRISAVSGALRECREYFDQRADADQPIGSHPIANEELKMLILIDEALASIGEGV